MSVLAKWLAIERPLWWHLHEVRRLSPQNPGVRACLCAFIFHFLVCLCCCVFPPALHNVYFIRLWHDVALWAENAIKHQANKQTWWCTDSVHTEVLHCSGLLMVSRSVEYEACTFKLSVCFILFQISFEHVFLSYYYCQFDYVCCFFPILSLLFSFSYQYLPSDWLERPHWNQPTNQPIAGCWLKIVPLLFASFWVDANVKWRLKL